MRKLAPVSSLLVLGVLGGLLAGCPVWDTEGHDHPTPTPDGSVPPTQCSANSECAGGYCNPATRQCVTSPACSAATACPSGYYCDARSTCVPGCSGDADCSRIAAGLVCSSSTRQCVPSGRCTSDAQCSGTTPVCLGGSCQPRSNLCQFGYQCTGSGQSCVDGRCVVECSTSNASRVCAAGQVCTNGRCAYPTAPGNCGGSCPLGQLCVDNVCLRTCANDAACGTGFMCDHGVCRTDTRPRPFCTVDSQCSAGSVCFNGACRRTCPTPGSGDGGCMTVDVQFDLCSAIMGRNLCTSRYEQNPQCARSGDCTTGRACVNARCL